MHDTQVLQRAAGSAQSLAAWLPPMRSRARCAGTALVAQAAGRHRLRATTIRRSEAWVAPDGRFRLGALAGAWAKPAAVYIGYAARAAARARRLAE